MFIIQVKFCKACGYENDKSFTVCRVCHTGELYTKENTIETFEDGFSFDSHLIPDRQQYQQRVHIGEPSLVNPNSFATVSLVLRSIGYRSCEYSFIKITVWSIFVERLVYTQITQITLIIQEYARYGTGQREWILLEVDGTIYSIVLQLMKHTFWCDTCNTSFYGKDRFTVCSIPLDILRLESFYMVQ